MKKLFIPLAFILLAACAKNDLLPDQNSKTGLDSVKPIGGVDTVPVTRIPAQYAGLDTNTYTDKPKFSGTFKGKLHYRYNDRYVEINTQVVFDGSDYKASAPADPDMGKGTFEVKSGRTVNFRDVGIYPGILDPGVFLQGNYWCFAKGDSLIMTKDVSYRANGGVPVYYQYRLKRLVSE